MDEQARLETLKSLCTACRGTFSWSAFHAKAKWPDGSMRVPQSHCKECVKAKRRQRRRDDPEWAREQYRKDWARIQADPVQAERRRELTRENSQALRVRRREEREAA